MHVLTIITYHIITFKCFNLNSADVEQCEIILILRGTRSHTCKCKHLQQTFIVASGGLDLKETW